MNAHGRRKQMRRFGRSTRLDAWPVRLLDLASQGADAASQVEELRLSAGVPDFNPGPIYKEASTPALRTWMLCTCIAREPGESWTIPVAYPITETLWQYYMWRLRRDGENPHSTVRA